MFNTKLCKAYFKSVIDRSRWIKDNPSTKIFESLPPEREFLLGRFGGQQDDDSFRANPLRIHYIDIEVAIEDVFPESDLAEYPINVNTVYDSHLKKYFVWVLKDDRWCEDKLYFEKEFLQKVLAIKGRDKEVPDVEFFMFDDEGLMLANFLQWFKFNRPDVITGWNIESFDMPYLINRMKLFVDEDVNQMSPIGDIRKVSRTQRGRSTEISTYKIAGVAILDYLLLYENKFFVGSKPSWKLENIAQDDLGYGKMQYEGTMKQFYRNEFKKFVAYNIIDVMLCVDLDERHNFINLARTICNMGLCEYEAIYKSSPYIVGALILEAQKKERIVITNDRVDYQDVTFEGAYVFPIEPGIYRDGICSLDLNSLYPNVIINLNISPETKIGKIVDETPTHKYLKLNSKPGVSKLTHEQISNLYGKVCISANNIVYLNPERQQGIIPSFLSRLYTERKSIKDQSKTLLKKNVIINEKIAELKALGGHQDTVEKLQVKYTSNRIKAEGMDQVQGAYKVFLNSIYGQLGSRYFAMFDLDNAEAVTLSSQRINRSSAEFINKYINERYKTDKDYLAGGDTDSLYFDIAPITHEIIGDKKKWNKKDVVTLCDYLDENFVPLVNEHCARISREEFLSPYTNIEFKREKLCERLAYFAKKRYIAAVRDDEGVYIPYEGEKKWKCTGVDIKKNELPESIKDVLRHITYSAIQDDWESEKYMGELTEAWNTFCEEGPDTIAYNKRYNTEKASLDFLKAEKGAGANAKAAIYYNQIIEDLGLKHKYDEIRLGSYLRFAYVNPGNRYGVEVIGWPDEYPEEFKEIFEINYRKMFEKVVMGPLKRLVEIYGWAKRHPDDEVVFDIFNL
jgi:DNA polymerase elongation subunit (family B)